MSKSGLSGMEPKSMDTTRITKSKVKKQSLLLTISTMICLCVALSDDEFVRIVFSAISFFLSIFCIYGWYLHSLPDDEFERRVQELEKSESGSSNSNDTTEFNLYHSPDAHFSPHNDD